MKKAIVTAAVVLGSMTAGVHAQTVLTSLPAIHALSNAQAGRHIPVEIEATVTYYRDYERTLFVQDGDTAIYVQASTGLKLMPGDRIRIRGTTHESFRPFVQSNMVERLSHGSMPPAVPASFDDLIRARFDCRLVTVRATVRSANVLNISGRNSGLQLSAEGGPIDVTLNSDDIRALELLPDSEVEITGVASGRFDGKMQQTGVLLHVSSFDNIRVLRTAALSPWSLPVTPMDEVLTRYHVDTRTERVRVHGTITYYQPGSAVVLQDGTKSLWISIQGRYELRIGDVADATGIPDVHDGFLTLSQAEVRSTGQQNPVLPLEYSWSELTLSHHIFDLVSVRGKVVATVREDAQDEYLLAADGHLFSAIIRHPTGTYSATAGPALLPMKQIPVDSTVQVTGICIQEDSNPFDQNVPFDVMMRSYDDISVVAWPSWMTVPNLAKVISGMLVIILGVSAWGWTLKRKVRRQTAVLAARAEAEADTERQNAQLQQQRSRILEDINGSRPLPEVLEEITEFVSLQLGGALCWCEIADGARLGRHTAETDGMRIVEEEIAARCGPPLGKIFAALDPRLAEGIREKQTFFMGAQLAALAIENRRLFSDLVHRSEFDLLTDIHNRFSLDKFLDTVIERAREDASIFGLIYVDLDEFKQVNDLYGHRVGDLYLQEVARRMKRQLRGADVLARLGGDEFAVVVPFVHCRGDVEEIATRLEHCFADPLAVEGYVLRGTASVGIALYPTDGESKDSLLCAADAAMYVRKHVKQQRGADHSEAGNGSLVTDKRKR